MVDDELEVEVRDPHARVALAGDAWRDVAPPAAEREVAVARPCRAAVDPSTCSAIDVGERGVALELGQPEGRPKRADDRVDQVGEDVLGVVELDAGEVARCSRRCRR